MFGYHKLSCLMAEYPDLLILKRFSTGNIFNALVLQAELFNLETEIAAHVVADQTSSIPDVKLYSEWVYKMKTCEDGQSQQWKLCLEYRRLLKEYNQAISSIHAAARYPSPKQLNLGTLQEWLQQKAGGAGFLHDPEHKVWEQNISDLASLSDTGENDDPISYFISNKFIPWFFNVFDSRRKKAELPLHNPAFDLDPTTVDLVLYRNTTITTIVNILSHLLASLLPILAIFGLYFVRNPQARLWMIAGFTAAFSIAFNLVTKSRRVEGFVITTALVAVMAVFVGNPAGTNCNHEQT